MRYPNHKQDLDPAALGNLPEFCEYEGAAPDLQHLRGVLIPTKDAARLVYVGERENLWVTDSTGRWRPWMGVAMTEVSPDTGAPVAPTYEYESLPKAVEGMSRADLARYGMTDADLEKAARELLGERWVAPESGRASKERQEIFDRVQTASHG